MDVVAWANNGAGEQLEVLREEDYDPQNLGLTAALMRSAYTWGYLAALSEAEPLTVDRSVRNREMLLLKLPV